MPLKYPSSLEIQKSSTYHYISYPIVKISRYAQSPTKYLTISNKTGDLYKQSYRKPVAISLKEREPGNFSGDLSVFDLDQIRFRSLANFQDTAAFRASQDRSVSSVLPRSRLCTVSGAMSRRRKRGYRYERVGFPAAETDCLIFESR